MKEVQELPDCDAQPDGEGANSGDLGEWTNFGLLPHNESGRLALDKRAAFVFLEQSSAGQVGNTMRAAESSVERGEDRVPFGGGD